MFVLLILAKDEIRSKLNSRKSKVLEHYFKGNIHETKKFNAILIVVMWIIGLILILSALALLKHPILT